MFTWSFDEKAVQFIFLCNYLSKLNHSAFNTIIICFNSVHFMRFHESSIKHLTIFEPLHKKTYNLHMQKQRRRSASR